MAGIEGTNGQYSRRQSGRSVLDSRPSLGRSKDAASFTHPSLFLSHLRGKTTKKRRKQRKLISIIHWTDISIKENLCFYRGGWLDWIHFRERKWRDENRFQNFFYFIGQKWRWGNSSTISIYKWRRLIRWLFLRDLRERLYTTSTAFYYIIAKFEIGLKINPNFSCIGFF